VYAENFRSFAKSAEAVINLLYVLNIHDHVSKSRDAKQPLQLIQRCLNMSW
jgi:hypothetical protein